MRLPPPTPPREGGGRPPSPSPAACDRVITVGTVGLGELVIGRQERAANRRCA